MFLGEGGGRVSEVLERTSRLFTGGFYKFFYSFFCSRFLEAGKGRIQGLGGFGLFFLITLFCSLFFCSFFLPFLWSWQRRLSSGTEFVYCYSQRRDTPMAFFFFFLPFSLFLSLLNFIEIVFFDSSVFFPLFLRLLVLLLFLSKKGPLLSGFTNSTGLVFFIIIIRERNSSLQYP